MDLWPLIGGRVGFAQIPEHGDMPPRSSPADAEYVANLYLAWVGPFDVDYISFMHNTRQSLFPVADGALSFQSYIRQP
jgi:hypothetical protein